MTDDSAAVGDKRQTDRGKTERRQGGRGGDRILAYTAREEYSEPKQMANRELSSVTGFRIQLKYQRVKVFCKFGQTVNSSHLGAVKQASGEDPTCLTMESVQI